jgi:hypothetical protein
VAHKLRINVQGLIEPVTEEQVGLTAGGLAGLGWRYTWHVRDSQGKTAPGTFTHQQGKVVTYRLPATCGIYRIRVVAARGSERQAAETQVNVLPRSL